MKKAVIIFFLLSCGFSASAQDYFQQELRFRIEARLDSEKQQLKSSRFEVFYKNNSPDTLREMYLHLYPNAFQPGSDYENLVKNNGMKAQFGPLEQQGKGLEVQNLKINGGKAETTLFSTLLKVRLPEVLPPGDSLTLSADFTLWFDDGGNLRRRAKMYRAWGRKHFNAVHWYPVPAVYDRRHGWNTDRHLDKEFYAEFAEFDVRLTLPGDYIADATGMLQNANKVLPPKLFEKIQLQNFKDKPYGSPPEPLDYEFPKEKTWHFRAKRVHNFAFTCSPTYRIQQFDYEGTRFSVLAQESHATLWQKTPGMVAYIHGLYSEMVGPYPYPKLLVADAREGFECGMAALVGGVFPNHIPLITHEIGHQWFQGAVGSNERDAAFLDEGFTEFLTIKILEQLYGEVIPMPAPWPFSRKRSLTPYRHDNLRLMNGYLIHFWKNLDARLNLHASDFRTSVRQAGGYGLSYQKGALMLENLRGILGDELFWKCIRSYYNTWKFKHPYTEDMCRSFTRTAGRDLDWFFDQWIESRKFADFAVSRIRRKGANDYEITLSRKGDMQMPLEVLILDRDSTEQRFFIPNSPQAKPSEAFSDTLSIWYGWGKNLRPKYRFRVKTEKPLFQVRLDPKEKIPEVRRDNNLKAKGIKGKIRSSKFDFLLDDPLINRSEAIYRHGPSLRYNSLDGLKPGWQLRGAYADLWSWKVRLWYNSGVFNGEPAPENFRQIPISFFGEAESRAFAHMPGFGLSGLALADAGVLHSRFRAEKHFYHKDLQKNRHTVLYAETLVFYSFENAYRFYLADFGNIVHQAIEWGTERKAEHFFSRLKLRTALPGSRYYYAFFDAEARKSLSYGKHFRMRMRLKGRISGGDVPPESRLYTASAAPEETILNPLLRARGVFNTRERRPGEVQTFGFLDGGLGLRAFSGSLIQKKGQNYFHVPHALGFNTEIDFPQPSFKLFRKIKSIRIRSYCFADAAVLYNKETLILADAGVGISAKIQVPSYHIGPYFLRLEAPLWLGFQETEGAAFIFRLAKRF